MATWYTDVAQNQQNGVNFPGNPGSPTLTAQPGSQNSSVIEGPYETTATYIWTGNEVANDIINLCIGRAGVLVSPNGHVSSGLTAPSSTLTFVIGDNDLAVATLLPIPNAQSPTALPPPNVVAPNWVSGASYVAGNVVTDPNSTPVNLTYTAVAATSGTTAPHSAANTVWMPNDQRYSNSIDVHAASGNVAFAGGTQLYGGPPLALTTNVLPSGYTAAQLKSQPYIIQSDCWIQALIATINATAINANAISVFRIAVQAAN